MFLHDRMRLSVDPVAFVFQKLQQDDRADRIIDSDFVDDLGTGQVPGRGIFLVVCEVAAGLLHLIIQVIGNRRISHDDVFIRENAGSGTEGPFAVAVCDLNGLKEVNDTLGHKAGDEHIRNACAVICNIFKHSPVYRIGGDEFAVILKGADYDKRADLMRELSELSAENRRNGGVVIAAGLSDFSRETDTSIENVFERADQLMYDNKKMLKTE